MTALPGERNTFPYCNLKIGFNLTKWALECLSRRLLIWVLKSKNFARGGGEGWDLQEACRYGLSNENQTDNSLRTYLIPHTMQRQWNLHETLGSNYFLLHSLEGKLETQFSQSWSSKFPKVDGAFECRVGDPKPTLSRKKIPFSDTCSWDRIFVCLFFK